MNDKYYPNDNRIEIEARICTDLKLEKKGEYSFAEFSIASKLQGKAERTGFFRCRAWKHLAEKIVSEFKKGDSIYIVGFLDFNQWEKDGVKHDMTFITVKQVYQPVFGKKKVDLGTQVEAKDPFESREEIPF